MTINISEQDKEASVQFWTIDIPNLISITFC